MPNLLTLETLESQLEEMMEKIPAGDEDELQAQRKADSCFCMFIAMHVCMLFMMAHVCR